MPCLIEVIPRAFCGDATRCVVWVALGSYADCASCIENKPVVNTDPTASLNVKLRTQVQWSCVELCPHTTTGSLTVLCVVTASAQVQELRSEIVRLYAQGADVSTRIVHEYSIGSAAGRPPTATAAAPVSMFPASASAAGGNSGSRGECVRPHDPSSPPPTPTPTLPLLPLPLPQHIARDRSSLALCCCLSCASSH
jgi:hypothetical protein